MKKLIIILLSIILILLLIITAILSYYLIVTIEAEVPEETISKCNIEEKTFQNRKVFIMSPIVDATNYKNNKINSNNEIIENNEVNEINPSNEISKPNSNNEADKNIESTNSDFQVSSDTQKYIIYLHGGSYVGEPEEEHWQFLQDIVADTKATIILPDYPLAPKYTYKEVFQMLEPLYKEILQKVSPENLILMGDSAGGGMALALEEKLSEENISLPNQLILISPWLDVTMSNSRIDEVQKNDKDLKKDALKLAGILYAGKDGMDNYLVNPINGPLEKLKNVTIYTGTYDILNPDVHILIEKAKQVNVNITLKEYEGAGHIWIVRKNTEPSNLAEEAYKDLLKTIDNT